MTHMSTRSLLAVGSLLAAALLAGCGPTVFQGDSGLKVVGNLPPPPPPPPKPAPPPPPPPEAPKRVKIVDNQIVINEKIQFAFDKAEILPESFGLLDEITKILQDNPHVKKVEVQGHASLEKDSAGHRMYNKTLSDKRAAAVKTYLVSHGVDAGRLTSKGFGNEKPLGDDKTEDGREKNRRVEFHILEQDVSKKEIPE